MKQPNFKEIVKENLSEDELSRLKTAFDAIGDIAILEIDDVLRDKEKFIAETLLKCQKNINTVLRKDSAHEGEFRTQKYVYLAGEDKRETIHKESNSRIKLDVEKVYYSPRMGHERLRIAEQIKEGEKVLVLFSGCGPYPVVLARNSKAKFVTAVEINPEGHKYAVENVKLNKLKNVHVFNGDAREFVERIFSRKIGLKSHWLKEQMERRSVKNPPIMEIHLNPADLDEHMEELEKCIKELKSRMEIVLHAPMHFRGTELSVSSTNSEITKNSLAAAQICEDLCKKHNLNGFILHPYTESKGAENNEEELLKNFKGFKHAILENIPHGYYSNPKKIKEFNEKGFNLCIDVAHLFMTRKTDEEFYDSIREIAALKPYWHIADTKYRRFENSNEAHHAHEIGTGLIDFERIVPYVDTGVIEVVSEDELHGEEILRSYDKYHEFLDNFLDFDRILMPMPMGGEDFLDIALKAARKGTTLHFYDFLHEDDFPLAEKKIEKACKKAGVKYKILSLNKCGQFSPKTFRICVDFVVN